MSLQGGKGSFCQTVSSAFEAQEVMVVVFAFDCSKGVRQKLKAWILQRTVLASG